MGRGIEISWASADNSIRHPHRDYFVPMTPVNAEIGVQGETLTGGVKLRYLNQTSIRKRHRPVSIAAHHRPQVSSCTALAQRGSLPAPVRQTEDRLRSLPSSGESRLR